MVSLQSSSSKGNGDSIWRAGGLSGAPTSQVGWTLFLSSTVHRGVGVGKYSCNYNILEG